MLIGECVYNQISEQLTYDKNSLRLITASCVEKFIDFICINCENRLAVFFECKLFHDNIEQIYNAKGFKSMNTT